MNRKKALVGLAVVMPVYLLGKLAVTGFYNNVFSDAAEVAHWIIDHDKKFKPNELFLPLYEGWRNPESARILIEDLNLYTVCTFDHEEMFDIDKRLWMLHREFCELFAKKEDVKNA